MKLKLFLPCIITVLWAGTVWGAAAGGTARQTGVFLPSIEIQSSVDGLDARDASNNIVANMQAQQDLRDIFLSSLFSLLMQPELYSYARACAVLAQKLGFGAQALTAVATATVVRVVEALLRGRAEKNLAIIFLAAFLAIVTVAAFRVPSSMPSFPLPAMAPVSLRC